MTFLLGVAVGYLLCIVILAKKESKERPYVWSCPDCGFVTRTDRLEAIETIKKFHIENHNRRNDAHV